MGQVVPWLWGIKGREASRVTPRCLFKQQVVLFTEVGKTIEEQVLKGVRTGRKSRILFCHLEFKVSRGGRESGEVLSMKRASGKAKEVVKIKEYSE